MRISDWRSDVYSSDLRMPRFGARLSAFRCGWREEPGRPGCPVLPEFIARENRARAEGPSRKKCGVGAARSRRRGHGHARLDGSQARATVAGMAMKERKDGDRQRASLRSEEHTSELQSLMRISYAVFCLKKKITLHSTTYSTILQPTINIHHLTRT